MNPDFKAEVNPITCPVPESLGVKVMRATVEPQPSEPVKAPAVTAEMLAQWSSVVSNILRKSKKLAPENEVELPEGGTGTYIKYALDKNGRLSTGRGRGEGYGRRKGVRLTSYQATKNKMTGMLFDNYLGSLFRARQKEAQAPPEVDGKRPDPKPMTQVDVQKAQAYAADMAERLTTMNAKAKAKAARKRQDVSRRINRGLIPGNSQRNYLTIR